MKKYDIMLILPDSVQREDVDPILDRVTADIEKLNGKVLGRNVLGKRTFARPLKKQEGGVYVEMKVELEPDGISQLLVRFKLNEEVFRAQITASRTGKAAEAAKGAEDGGSE